MIATLNYRGVFVASRQTKIRQHCRRTVVVVPLQRNAGADQRIKRGFLLSISQLEKNKILVVLGENLLSLHILGRKT